MKITVRNIILSAFVAALLSGCNGLPFRGNLQVLNAAEVEHLFVGNTVESYNLNTGFNSFTYYHANGQALQERLWARRIGSWSLQKDGQICLGFNKHKMKCRHIVRDGDRYYKVRTGKDGELEKLVRYRYFKQGNALSEG